MADHHVQPHDEVSGSPGRLLVLSLGLALLSAGLLWLPRLVVLNHTAAAVAQWMVDQKLPVDWWLTEADPVPCPGLGDIGRNLESLRRHGERLQGLVALACGDKERASLLLQEPSQLPLLMAEPDAARTEPTLSPENTTASYAWGAVVKKAREAFDHGDQELAVTWLDSLTPTLAETPHPDRVNLYFSACFIYRRAARFASALDACKKLVTVRPRNPEAWNLLGLVHLAQNRLDDAEISFRRATELEQGDWAKPWINLGRVYLAQGQVVEAQQVLQQAVQRAPGDAWANFYLAQALLAQGDCAQASSYLSIALASESVAGQPIAIRTADQYSVQCLSPSSP